MSRMLRRKNAGEQVRNAEMNFAFDRERANYGYKLPNAGATPSPSESDGSEEEQYKAMYGTRLVSDEVEDGHTFFGSGLNFKFIVILVLLFFAIWSIVSRSYQNHAIDNSQLTKNKIQIDLKSRVDISNDMTDSSSKAFPKSDLNGNYIHCDDQDEPKYWMALGRSIAPPARCTSYDLSGRSKQLGDKGVRLLVKGMLGASSGRLEKLVLTNQGITSRGVSHLAQLITSAITQPTCINVSFFLLDVRGNPIGFDGLNEIQSAVDVARRVSWMKVVVLGGGRVDSSRVGIGLLKVFSRAHRSSNSAKEESTYDSEWRLTSFTEEEERIKSRKQNPNITIALGFGCLFISVFFLTVFRKTGAPPPLSNRRHAVRYQ